MRRPQELKYLSEQLFANAVFISDSSSEMLSTYRLMEESSSLENRNSLLPEDAEPAPYPLNTEADMFRAISEGDSAEAARALNEILGHILFHSSGDDEFRARITELFVMMTRAAAYGGAGLNHVLGISAQYLREMRGFQSREGLTRWLASSLHEMTALVFQAVGDRHTAAMAAAAGYMKDKFAERITLEEVSEHVGYSPAYFSRIFKEDMGMTFKEYLNKLRIEKSKNLLISGNLPIVEISAMVGFNDQSYFSRTFKQLTGVTPDRYRKRSRRIDRKREYGLK